jgi:Ser/Thr protein kinase RdoA (MazF antagonist)
VRAELEHYVQTVLGPCRFEKDWSWDHGEANVLQAVDAAGVTWFAKRHGSRHKYDREVTAYQDWVPALAGRAPRLRAFDDDLPALVLSAVPGQVYADDTPPLHHQAGALLRRFHDVEFLSPWTDFAAAKQAEFDAWTSRSDGLLSAREIDFVRSEVRGFERLPVPPRVPCHLDYTSRNWLVADGKVYIIDFERARPEIWINDVGRLHFGVWQDQPGLREAFWDGYGRTPAADDLALLIGGYALTAMSTIIWARQHGDEPFERWGREVLEGLMRRAYG